MLAQTVTKRKLVQDPAVLPTGGGNDGVTIRRSAPGDGPAISRLGRLEARRPERGPYVLAERGGEVFAAAPLSGGTPWRTRSSAPPTWWRCCSCGRRS